MLEDIFEEEKWILESIEMIDSEKRDLIKKYQENIDSIDFKKKRKKYELKHFYHSNIVKLYHEAVNVAKEKNKDIRILIKHDYEEMGRDHYHIFFILPENHHELFAIPGTHDNYCKWQLSLNQKKSISIEELIYYEGIGEKNIKELYNNLKEIIKNGND
jgi:hypothetical protein